MSSDTVTKTERPAEQATNFQIAEWLIEPRAGRITRDQLTVHLRPQLMDLAVVFATRPTHVLSKEELFAAVWPGQYVAESALARCVAELRQVFGDDARSPRVIETIPKRGYRMVAPVTTLPLDGCSLPVPASAANTAQGPPTSGRESGQAIAGWRAGRLSRRWRRWPES